jgi:protein subunit release factor B
MFKVQGSMFYNFFVKSRQKTKVKRQKYELRQKTKVKRQKLKPRLKSLIIWIFG